MAKQKVKRQAVYLPYTDEQWKFIQDHVTVEQRVALLIQQAEKNAGCTFEQYIKQKSAQEAFYAEYNRLTADLSDYNEQALTLALPIQCNADTPAVEEFIVNHWKQPVTDGNFKEVGFAFKRWFKENYPDEYATPETAMFNPWRVPIT